MPVVPPVGAQRACSACAARGMIPRRGQLIIGCSTLPNALPAQRRTRRAIIIGGPRSGPFAAAFLKVSGGDGDRYEGSRGGLVGRGAGLPPHAEVLQAREEGGDRGSRAGRGAQ